MLGRPSVRGLDGARALLAPVQQPVPSALLASVQQPAVLDPVQEALLAEPCILVDRQDKVIGEVRERKQLLNNLSPIQKVYLDPLWL